VFPVISPKEQYEQAIAVGVVFSPSLLMVFPFAQQYWAPIAASVAMLWLVTLGGYLAYRKAVPASPSFWLWQSSLFLLQSLALLASASLLSLEGGGAVAAGFVVAVYALVFVLGWRALLRPRNPGRHTNTRLVGAFGAFGASSSGLLVAALGPGFIQSLVVTAHLFLAICTSALAARSIYELLVTQRSA
jgi:hypothetical protein